MRRHNLAHSVFALAFLVALSLSPAAWAQTTYYVGPDGADSNDGTTESAPLGSFDAAISELSPGDTLVLLDGTYPVEDGEGGFMANCNGNAQNGTEDARITVRAQNERRAYINTDGSVTPFGVVGCSYWDVEGIRASGDDYPEGASEVFLVDSSDHVRTRRLLLDHANRYQNSDIMQVRRSHHVLVEEIEGYFFHRHGLSVRLSDHVTVRRSFLHARNAADLDDEDAWESHNCCQQGGDEGVPFYFSSNSIMENTITMHSENMSVIAGVATALGNPGGQNVKFLGNISYKDLRPGGFLQSRRFLEDIADRFGGFTGPSDNIVFRDFLVVGGQQIDSGGDYSWHVARNVTLNGATIVDVKRAPISLVASTRPHGDRSYLGCDREELGGCRYRVRNALFLNNEYDESGSLLATAPPEAPLDMLVAYSNAWSSEHPERGFGVEEDISDNVGRYQHAMSVEPTGMGLGEGECIAYVPESSNMSGAGTRGGDIGANILYRYEDGELTDEPLWNPETGEFPHGAVIEGSANDPALHDVVMANIHEHLNVNTSGCPLPYASGTASSTSR